MSVLEVKPHLIKPKEANLAPGPPTKEDITQHTDWPQFLLPQHVINNNKKG
jgi:hypothetical protein